MQRRYTSYESRSDAVGRDVSFLICVHLAQLCINSAQVAINILVYSGSTSEDVNSIKRDIVNKMRLSKIIEKFEIKPTYTNYKGNFLYIDGEIYDAERLNQTHRLNVIFNGRDNNVHIDGSLWIDGVLNVYFNGNENVARLGANGYVGADTTIMFYQAGPGIECYGCTVTLGDRFKLNGSDIMIEVGEPNTSVRIGDDALIASGVRLMTSDGHQLFSRSTRQRINPAANIDIGNRVWLCRDVMIMPGGKLANHTTVAARSVVTRQFHEDYTLLAGIPARVKKQEVVWAFTLDSECPED